MVDTRFAHEQCPCEPENQCAALPCARHSGGALGRCMYARRSVLGREVQHQCAAVHLLSFSPPLQKAFGGGEGSNALVEIRSYREPPRVTYAVLQAVLMLSGHTEDQVHNWGAMRMLTKYALIKRLVKLKPAQVCVGVCTRCNTQQRFR